MRDLKPDQTYLAALTRTLEQADAMPDDAANGFGRSASLDTAGAEGAKPCATAASHKHIVAPQRLLYYSYISHITSL